MDRMQAGVQAEVKDMADTEGARRATAVSADGDGRGPGHPEPEVVAKPKRRRFSAEYRLRILKQADTCKGAGERGALLRREGLYSSHLVTWRRQREEGALAEMRRRKRGPKARAVAPRVKQLEKENARLQRRLKQAETIMEVQKNSRGPARPAHLLDEKLLMRLSSRAPGRSGRQLIGVFTNP
jgi:transposase-like protein